MGKKLKVQSRHFDTLLPLLKKAIKNPNVSFSMIQTIKKYAGFIVALKELNYSSEEIADIFVEGLAETNINLSKSTLITYINNSKQFGDVSDEVEKLLSERKEKNTTEPIKPKFEPKNDEEYVAMLRAKSEAQQQARKKAQEEARKIVQNKDSNNAVISDSDIRIHLTDFNASKTAEKDVKNSYMTTEEAKAEREKNMSFQEKLEEILTREVEIPFEETALGRMQAIERKRAERLAREAAEQAKKSEQQNNN